MNKEVEEIVAYVKKHDLVRWTDLEVEFVKNRGWSKGKFVNHFKVAKKFLDKLLDPKSGRPRYHVKKQYGTFAGKALLKSEVAEGVLHEVVISKERIGKIKETMINTISRGKLTKGLTTYQEARKTYGETFDLIKHLVRITIITPKGETTPTLTDNQIQQLVLMLWRNCADPNLEKVRKSLHVIASFEVPQNLIDRITSRSP